MANDILIETECPHCGANLNIDFDNLINRCPYCDQKVLIDPDPYKEIIAEREATKREEMRIAHEKELARAKENEKQKRKELKIALGAGAVICLLITGITMAYVPSTSLGFMGASLIPICALLIMADSKEGADGNKDDEPARKKNRPPEIEKVTIASSKTSKNVGSIVARSVVGGAFMGPLGLLLGFTAEDETETTFIIEYDDGQIKTETAKSNSARYKELSKYL